jgi:hypothetical protein
MTSVPDEAPWFILALDPGKTTGYAWLDSSGAFGYGEIEGRFAVYSALRQWAAAGARPEIVIEEFTVRGETHKMSRQPDPWAIIGYVEGLCDQHGWSFDTQTPGQAKGFATDDKLRAMGWEATTKGGHARDAARHLLTYLARKYGKPGQLGHDLLRSIMETLT